jgi:hypothetical protein
MASTANAVVADAPALEAAERHRVDAKSLGPVDDDGAGHELTLDWKPVSSDVVKTPAWRAYTLSFV